jgi:hypothetical protein
LKLPFPLPLGFPLGCLNLTLFILSASKKKEIILSAAIIFGALFVMPTEARPIGVPVRLPSAPEINRPAPQHFHQHAPTVNPRVDKIIMMTNNKMILKCYRIL